MLAEGVVRLSAVRWRARAPRLVFCGLCTVLCVAGLRATFTRSAATAPQAVVEGRPLVADGFAEGFARAYLSFSDARRRDRALKMYGYAGDGLLTGGAGRVVWTGVVGRERSRMGTVVTVAADDGRRLWFLAVTVAADRRGRRFVPVAPAVIGPPAVRPGAVSRPELEVDDRQLRQVVERVVRHYLAGERVDLAADLMRGAAVTYPLTRLRLIDVSAITWVTRPARVAVSVTAGGPGGIRLPLRYELQVLHVGGRWLVRSIQVNPFDRG